MVQHLQELVFLLDSGDYIKVSTCQKSVICRLKNPPKIVKNSQCSLFISLKEWFSVALLDVINCSQMPNQVARYLPPAAGRPT